MSFPKEATNHMKFSVVDKIVDKKGKEFLLEVKFSKEFFTRYSNNIKKDLCIVMFENPYITAREIQVLKYMAQGKHNSQIAKDLNVSVHTAKVHVQNILKKLSVFDRTAAVVSAIKLGLLDV